MDTRAMAYIALMTSLYINIALSVYGVISKPNLVKKFIALTILQDSVNIFLILGGYRLWDQGAVLQPPVLLNWSPTQEDIQLFIKRSVDPLPQALVLTAIVIGLAVNILLSAIILHLYRHFNTVDMDDIGKLKRETILGEAI